MTSEHPLLTSPFPRSVFVTGTGTDVGKTLCSALLCTLWDGSEYWKPVQSGGANLDGMEILRLSPSTGVHLSVQVFKEPASPHLAAQLEGKRIEVSELVELRPEAECLVVEGAGGALVPLNDMEDMADLCDALSLPAIVVASTGLGTIHHTLATVQALKIRGCEVAGVLLNGPPHGENARQIRDRGGVVILGRVPSLFPLDAQSLAQLAADWKGGLWVDPCDEETPVQPPLERLETLAQRDARTIWHPYTQHRTAPVPLEIERAHGALLFTAGGEEIVDAVSSWWVCNHGHAHPRIAQAIADQAKQLEQVIFAGCTHEPGVQLAEKLLPLLPGKPSRLFYSDNGSTAIEVAIKALVQRAVRRGVQEPRIGCLEGAYHGDTFGAMAVGERSVFTSPFDRMLFRVDRLKTPAGPWSPESQDAEVAAESSLRGLRAWLEAHASEIACLVVEPLVQGSGGMQMYGRLWLEGMDKLCRKHSVPWVADEVFTGFGRTGSLFACSDKAGMHPLTPSAVCLSKGLTGGFLPLGATAFAEEIYEDFLSEERVHAFFHGHSFTGNPLGCSAALASLELSTSTTTQVAWGQIEAWHREGLAKLERRFAIRGARIQGTIAAFDLPDAKGGYLASRGQDVVRICRERGVLLRPLGDTIYIVPPYCLRASQHEKIIDELAYAIGEVLAH
jgi:adenosylmethionine-8-amino-7-oxononanoate aminotransferase